MSAGQRNSFAGRSLVVRILPRSLESVNDRAGSSAVASRPDRRGARPKRPLVVRPDNAPSGPRSRLMNQLLAMVRDEPPFRA